jgi:H+/Cl- antiporter ClcA
MMKKFSVFVFLFVSSVIVSFGQCAMCKATLETKVGDADYVGVGAGINAGVLYLMVVPYLLLVLIVLMFRYKKKQAQKAELVQG